MAYYFNNHIREHLSVFGSLFSDIFVRHYNETNILVKEIKVPISYSNKDKFIQMYTMRGENPENYGDNVMLTLPRFGFEITGFSYNPEQKLNRLNKYIDYKENIKIDLYDQTTIGSEADIKIDEQTKNIARSVYTPVSYKMHMNLYLMTNKETDSLQIVEQILPIFTTFVMVPTKYKIGEDVFLLFDESVNLESVNKEVNFQQDFDKISKTIHTFSFSMDIKFFGGEQSERTSRIIKHITFHLGLEGSENTVETVDFAAAPMPEKIVVDIDRWYDEFYNYMYHDIQGDDEFQILEKWDNI